MKKKTKKAFIYFRYLFPIAAGLCMLALMCVPVYRFVTADGSANSAISLGELLGNSWETVRQYLFDGGADKNIANIGFSRAVLVTVIAVWVLFFIGFASTVYAAVSAFSYFAGGCKPTHKRAVFLTVVPNRAVLCIYHALMLPIFFFPSLMPLIYKMYLIVPIKLKYTFGDMLWFALALYAALVVIVVISSAKEVSAGMDIFTKQRQAEKKTEKIPEERKESNDILSQMDRKTREEQNERILRLLGKFSDGEGNDSAKEEDK